MKLFIDADGCPVVDLTLALAKKYNIECVILCDTAHRIERPDAVTVTVEKGADSVDFKLVNMLSAGDIAITQDYGLAAMCLAKKALPLHQNGFIYNDGNIDQLLFTRYLSKKLRNAGGRTKGPPKRTVEDDRNFSRCLEKILQNRT